MKFKPRFILYVLVFACALFAAAETADIVKSLSFRPKGKESLDLSGTVLNEKNEPVAGATAYIYTAKVRVGTSPYCPSCYPDCGKREMSDAKGNFNIRELDADLMFRVLIVADGYEPQFAENVDPKSGPVRFGLKAINPARLKPGHVLRGKVGDENGKPVVGAIVEPFGMKMKSGGAMYGRLSGVDPLAITDEKGEFTLTSQEAGSVLDLQVKARDLAPKNFLEVPVVDSAHSFKLTPGASVFGKAIKNGKPLSGVLVGLVQADRGAEVFLGAKEIGTNEKGEFLFSNVPSGFDYYVYGIMSSLAEHGAIAEKMISVKKEGEMVDAGKLTVQPAFRLAGRVVLSDNKPIPTGTRLLVGADRAWDTLSAILNEQGKFELKGLPAGLYNVSVRIPGYIYSKTNKSVEQPYPLSLKGRIDQDKTNLVIVHEPGALPQTISYTAGDGDNRRDLENLPLAGAEEEK